MSNTRAYQREAVRRIMGRNKVETDETISHFTVDEKCTAISNWQKNSNVEFDLSFIESVHDQFLRNGKCSDKQIAALDRIITKYNVDVGMWHL